MKELKKINNPEEIERLSFKIIEDEIKHHNFDKDQWRIVRRIIHTTADLELVHNIIFHQDAVSSALNALNNRCKIFTDTKMAMIGINKKNLTTLKCSAMCYINYPDVVRLAKSQNITRASASVRYLASSINGSIYVVGNAPTALITLFELITYKKIKPALVVAVPVGFVNAKESKDLFIKFQPVPFITIKGRKGGSAIGASIINELLKMAIEKQKFKTKDK